MTGERRVAQEPLPYEFSLDRHVPADHLLRAIDRFVDLSRCASICRDSTARSAALGDALLPSN